MAVAHYDVVVIGAGHNALIATAYLARAGQHVVVLEKRATAGGAVATEELTPGYRIDIGGSAHALIRLTPIVQELELEAYGLEYLELDPIMAAPAVDADPIYFYRDVERTVDHLETLFPGEGVAYRRFIDDWRPFALKVRDAFLAPPAPIGLARKVAFGRRMPLPWRKALSFIKEPYGSVPDAYLKEERLKAALVWMAAQSGPPPTEPLTAPFLLWHPLYHVGGIARPRGGSGMLTQALQRCIESHGGEVRLVSPVERIVVENGRAVAAETASDTARGRVVLAGTHIRESLGRLLPPAHRPPDLARARAGNGFGVMLRLALDAPVRYASAPGDETRRGLQLLCRDRHQINAAYGEFLAGRPASDPPLVAMTFSAVDDTLAPPGGEVLWLWGQYFPYELAGREWDDELVEEVTETLISAFELYVPDVRRHIRWQLLQHPEWLERELGLHRGNVMHLEMSIDQMFCARPFAGQSQYRSHIDNLYLTGASTHPGGGIMGASGRNAAHVMLKDLRRGKR